VDPELGLATLFEVSVSGMEGSGTVGIQLPAGRVMALNGQTPNRESRTDEAEVNYTPRLPTHRVVAWDGFEIAPDAAPHPARLHQLETGFGWASGWQVQDFLSMNLRTQHTSSPRDEAT
jgi:hypothetical protein